MSRLIAAGLAPQRGGQPIRVWAYISLADLMQLEGSADLVQEWTGKLTAQWAGHRAAAAEAGGHQGLWLDGDAAQGIACGAPVTPVVVGNMNPAAFDDLIRLCAQLDKLLHRRPDRQPDEDQPGTEQPARAAASPATASPARSVPRPRPPDPSWLRKRCSRPSSARPSSCSRVPAAWLATCAVTSVSGPAAPACRWTSGTARPSPRRSVTRSAFGTSTASGPAAAASPPQLRRPSHEAQGQRRPDQPRRRRPALPLSPSGHDSPTRLDPRRQPRRHHHRVEQGQDQGPAQPRAARPGRVTGLPHVRPPGVDAGPPRG